MLRELGARTTKKLALDHDKADALPAPEEACRLKPAILL